jgi:hypothetical protein
VSLASLIKSPLNAVKAIGTSSNDCALFCAVPTISSNRASAAALTARTTGEAAIANAKIDFLYFIALMFFPLFMIIESVKITVPTSDLEHVT